MTEVFTDREEAEEALLRRPCESDWTLTQLADGRWEIREATAEESAAIQKALSERS